MFRFFSYKQLARVYSTFLIRGERVEMEFLFETSITIVFVFQFCFFFSINNLKRKRKQSRVDNSFYFKLIFMRFQLSKQASKQSRQNTKLN